MLKWNLQFFADEDNNTELSGEEELAAAIRSLLDSENEEEIEEEETDVSPDAEEETEIEETETEIEEEELEEETESTEEEKGRKREQSKEENARFAAQRRQKELDDKLQAELEKVRNESPEFQLAKQLSEMYGTTPDVILQQMKEEALKQRAEKTGVPIEYLKEQQVQSDKVTALEQELNNLRFQGWQNQIKADTENLKGQYPMLTQEDFDKATDYILNVAKNVNLPLEDAVYAVHGRKIIENLSNAKVQEDLAKQSGRSKKTPPSPNNGKPSKVVSLTAEERYVAKQMGISEEDYLKYK